MCAAKEAWVLLVEKFRHSGVIGMVLKTRKW